MLKYKFIVLFSLASFYLKGQDGPLTQLIAKDSLSADFETIVSILKEGHTGLYNYANATEIEVAIAKTRGAISTDMTEREFTSLMSEFIAQLQCGHTYIRASTDYLKAYAENYGSFPVQLRSIKNRLYLYQNYTDDTTLYRGMELISVDDKPIATIMNDLLPMISSDAGNKSWKMYQLTKHFGYYYRIKYGETRSFVLQLKDKTMRQFKTVNVIRPDTLQKRRLRRYPQEQHLAPLYFSVLNDGNTGYLRVNTFNSAKMKRYGQSFFPYMKKSFKTLRKTACKNLILDLRGNTGGRTDNAIELARYLKSGSFKAYQHIEIKSDQPLSYVNYTRKMQKFTYKNTEVSNDRILWKNKLYTKRYKSKKKRFDGHLFVLIDGGVFSGGSHLAALLYGRDKTLFIGEKTGGSGKLSNGGVMTTITLKYSKCRLTVPMFKGTYTTKNGNSVAIFPDKEIYPTQEGLKHDRDGVIHFTFDLINSMD